MKVIQFEGKENHFFVTKKNVCTFLVYFPETWKNVKIIAILSQTSIFRFWIVIVLFFISDYSFFFKFGFKQGYSIRDHVINTINSSLIVIEHLRYVWHGKSFRYNMACPSRMETSNFFFRHCNKNRNNYQQYESAIISLEGIIGPNNKLVLDPSQIRIQI